MRRALLLGFVAVLVFALCPLASFAQYGTNSLDPEDHELPWGDNIQRNYNSPLDWENVPGFGGRDLGMRSKLRIDYHDFDGWVALRGRIFMTQTFTHTAVFYEPNDEDTEYYYDVSSQFATYDFVFTDYDLQPGDFVTGWHELYIWEDE